MLGNELAAAYENGERILASELPFEQPRPPLAPDVFHRLARFLAFSKEKCARACPARPQTVAAFVVHEHSLGTPAQQILSLLEAIASHHDHHGLANPVATAVVRLVLDDVIRAEPPRSWPKEDKILFATLPPDIRDVIARREQEREAGLRRAQNVLAEEKKRLLADSADKSASNDKSEKETKND